MANFTKFNSYQMGHILSHIARTTHSIDCPIQYSNENIDLDRTHLNYCLSTPLGIQNDNKDLSLRVNTRLSQIHHINRNDLIVLVGFIVTLPKDFPIEREKDFFTHSYNYLSNLFGKENEIAAYVHLDEVTPHLHYAFVPVIPLEEERKGFKESLNAKQLINRQFLREFHPQYKHYLDQKFGFSINVITHTTKENLTMAEYKLNQQHLELQSKEQYLNELKEDLEEKASKYEPKKGFAQIKNTLSLSKENKLLIVKMEQKDHDIERLQKLLAEKDHDLATLNHKVLKLESDVQHSYKLYNAERKTLNTLINCPDDNEYLYRTIRLKDAKKKMDGFDHLNKILQEIVSFIELEFPIVFERLRELGLLSDIKVRSKSLEYEHER